MKILVTGGRGFLGHFLVKKLEANGHSVTTFSSKECDLTKPDSLTQFADIKFDQIFHLAAWTQAGDFCLKHPGEQWLMNQKINTYVLDFWQKDQPQAKLIAMGTSCGYSCELPLSEENYLEGQPIESLFTYGMTKRMLLVGLKALAKQYGLKYLYAIPSTLYGPNYHTDGRQMHFIFDLIRKILRGKEHGDPVVLWGDGHQQREIVHVDQFVSHLLEVNDLTENTIVNLGAGEEYSIRDFAKAICDHVGYPFEKIEYDTSKYVGAKSKVLKVDKLKKLLTTFDTINLNDGLKETIDWMASLEKSLIN
ncbi:MAG: GDP-L-fucose synthase [Chlamydiia bacterium]|nr:GDP-L-fucose synthase [Chlamydiia bacterium]MCH9616523.1 GDP-L-fucose synthase [Chlamydiia bacterium]MCH9629254.1 GDP-L-fucose synthase [Chlamydiia bacterium]